MSKLRKLYKFVSKKTLLDGCKIPLSLYPQAQEDLNAKIRSAVESLKRASVFVYKSKDVVFQANGETCLRENWVGSPDKDQVVIRADKTIISPGTERAQLNRLPNARVSYPFVPGYSGTGIVLQAGANTGLKINQRVCGSIPHALVSKVAASDVYPIPDGVGSVDAALVTFAIIVLRGLEKATIDNTKHVVIIGQGIIGQLLLLVIKGMGPKACTVITRSSSKHAISYASGADNCLTLSDREAINDLSADVIFDVTPDPSTIELASAVASNDARIVLLGSSRGICESFSIRELLAKSITIEGAHARMGLLSYTERFNLVKSFYKLIENGVVRSDLLVSQTVAPQHVGKFYFDLSKGRYSQIGSCIDWCSVDNSSGKNAKKQFILSNLLPDIRGVEKASPVLVGYNQFNNTPAGALAENGQVISYALIGCGEIGLTNAKSIMSSANAKLTYVVDSDILLAKDIASQFNCAYSVDYNDAINDTGVDAVYISTPHHLHIPIAKRACEQGKHCIIEKPLANNIAQAEIFYNTIQGTDLKSTVAFLFRYDPQIQFFAQLVADKAIGEVRGVEFSLKVNKPESYWQAGNVGRTHSDWRKSKEKAGGGIIIMQLCHHLDIIRYVTGLEVEEVSCVRSFESGLEVESAANVSFKLSNGAIGVIKCTYLSKGLDEKQLTIIGTEGQLDVYDALFYSVNAVNGLPSHCWYQVVDFPLVKLRKALIEDFSNAIIKKCEPVVTLLDGLKAQEIIGKCYENGIEGTAEALQSNIQQKSIESESQEAHYDKTIA